VLQRKIGIHGVTWYQSPLLTQAAVPHGFTTRIGGVSTAPFDSLNFQPASRSVAHLGPGPTVVPRDREPSSVEAEPSTGIALLRSSAPPVDQHETVVENFRRFREAVGCPNRRVICLWQVHGAAVCVWPQEGNDATPEEITAVVAQADALVSADPKVLISVRIADCVPVLLANRSGTVVAAVHAGWRGVVDGVVTATLDTMSHRFDVPPADIIAAIGPCISAEHFEVGIEVADAFDRAGLADAVRRDFQPRPHIDLQHAIAFQLTRAGVAASHIDRNDRCTFRDRDEFYSHRRDEGRTGRMAAVIGTRAAT